MTPSAVSSHLGDVILCPVCLMVYEDRIMQCSQGHSVCERCYSRLSQCPTCRSIFAGARNYALEDVIAKLSPAYSDQPPNSPADPTQCPRMVEADAHVTRLSRSQFGPVQAPGHYVCRIGACQALLPVCRMPNHLRYFHSWLLTEFRTTFLDKELQFVEQWKLPLRAMYRAVQISRVGLFFVIMEVDANESKDECMVSAWVEAVCSSDDARAFRFGCEFVCAKSVASYSDVVYGGNANGKEIKRKNQCLQVMVPLKIKRVQLQVRIYRNIGVQNLNRSNTTMVRVLPSAMTKGVKDKLGAI